MLQRVVFRHAVFNVALVPAMVFSIGAHAGAEVDFELSGRLSVESRWYPESPAYTSQSDHVGGLILEPELHFESADSWSFSLVPFLRYDSTDSRRSHADLREAYFLTYGEIGESEWELRFGFDRVFWGVIESNHLVDIINQTDLIEHPDEEVELGQLMVHATLSGDWGVAELFVLPHHRERIFSGSSGRLRSDIVVDDGRASYESSAREWHIDFAVRYSHSSGPFDVGMSLFDGTSREPLLRPMSRNRKPLARPPSGSQGDILVPHYEQIRQFGLDAQMTTDAWLFKLEAIHRGGAQNLRFEEDDYAAFVAGVEYTFYSVFDSDADFSVLAEWNYDERGGDATNVFDDDLFFAIRYALNGVQTSEVFVSFLRDREYSSGVLVVEFNRRISDHWSFNLESFSFFNVDEEDIQLYQTRRDSFMELRLNYNF